MKLSFRLGSIPVSIHASFLFVAVMLGIGGDDDPRKLAIWVAVVLVGVLAHELGHALVGRSFGLAPQIDLIGFGGLTSWKAGTRNELGTGRRIAISLAGPFVGIAIGALAYVYARVNHTLTPLQSELVWDVIWVNAGWGILNLLPILPLDGGNVAFVVIDRMTGGRGERPARILSIVVAGTIAVLALYTRQTFNAVFAGMFAVQNFQALRVVRARDADAPLRAEVARGFEAVARGEGNTAVRSAMSVLDAATMPDLRADAIRLLAMGHLLEGAWGPLMQIMTSPASNAIADDELEKFERAATELGRPEEAQQIAAVRARRAAFQGG